MANMDKTILIGLPIPYYTLWHEDNVHTFLINMEKPHPNIHKCSAHNQISLNTIQIISTNVHINNIDNLRASSTNTIVSTT